MARRIRWSASAVADRIQILDYWYRRTGSKIYPRKLDMQFRDVLKLLLQFPDLGRRMEEREERFLVKGDYQIFYQERGEFIEILHIWDSRRDPEDFPL